MSDRLVYVAGPLFSEFERACVSQVAAICERHGFRTFVPHRDAGMRTDNNGFEIFSADLSALERADVVLAILEGADADSGTAWEIGYAVARGKSVIGLRTDVRPTLNGMIAESVFVVRNLSDLDGAIHALGNK